MKGKIKWYNARKGYGFIEGEDKKDTFVHRDSIPDGTNLNEGDEVEYEIEDSDKGPQATNVKKLQNVYRHCCQPFIRCQIVIGYKQKTKR